LQTCLSSFSKLAGICLIYKNLSLYSFVKEKKSYLNIYPASLSFFSSQLTFPGTVVSSVQEHEHRVRALLIFPTEASRNPGSASCTLRRRQRSHPISSPHEG
jgi:hypothetical protein